MSFKCDPYLKSHIQRNSLVFCVHLLLVLNDTRTGTLAHAALTLSIQRIHLEAKVFYSLENDERNPFDWIGYRISQMNDRSIDRSSLLCAKDNDMRFQLPKTFFSTQYKNQINQ